MALSDEQINQLFLFTEKKSVRYYDLQIELVDHLASRIEEELLSNPALSFDNALKKVYAGFGLFGFSKIVEQKENEVIKQNRQIWIKEILAFIKIPKIAFTAFIILAIYQLTLVFPFTILSNACYLIFLVYYSFTIVGLFRNGLKERKRILLLKTNIAFSTGVLPILEYSIFCKNNPNTILFSIAVALSFILSYSTYTVYKKVRSTAVHLYPEAFVVAK